MINVYALLNPIAGIQALVGTGTSPQSSRIYPGVAPESATLPYIECHGTDEPISTLSGVGDPHREDIQFSCYATTYDGAQALATAVHAALQGNGYQNFRSSGYDERTKLHGVFMGWSFIV